MSVPVYTQPPSYEQSRIPNRTPWIVFGIIGGLIVIGSLGFIILVATGVFTAITTLKYNGPTPVRYYVNMVEQDYSQAFANLDSNATINGQHVDQQTFTTMASALDAQRGRITGFVVNDGNDVSHTTLTVYRSNQSYVVHLVLRMENGVWKIVSADGI